MKVHGYVEKVNFKDYNGTFSKAMRRWITKINQINVLNVVIIESILYFLSLAHLPDFIRVFS